MICHCFETADLIYKIKGLALKIKNITAKQKDPFLGMNWVEVTMTLCFTYFKLIVLVL